MEQLVVRAAYALVVLVATFLVLQLVVRRSIIEQLVRKNVVTASTADQMYKPLEALAAVVSALAAAYIVFGDPVLAAAIVAVVAAIAAALWPLLVNIFAYYAVLLSHRLRSGDLVAVRDLRGRVIRVTPTHTAIRGRGGRIFLIPNRLLLDASFEKAGAGSTQLRVRVSISIPRTVDKALEALAAAEAKLKEAMYAKRLVQKGQEVSVVVERLEPGAAILELVVPLPTPEPRIQLVNNVIKSVAEALEGYDPKVAVVEETLP